MSHHFFGFEKDGALIIGIISCISGVLLFKIIGLPAGPLVILTASLIFLISLIFKRR